MARTSQVELVVKNLPANAGDEMKFRCLGWEDPLVTHSIILALRIP